MLSVEDAAALIREVLCRLEEQCDIFEKIQPGNHRALWVLSLERQIKKANKLIDDTEEKCQFALVQTGDAEEKLMQKMLEAVRFVSSQYQENELLHEVVQIMERQKKVRLAELLAISSQKDAEITQCFNTLRASLRHIQKRQKAL